MTGRHSLEPEDSLGLRWRFARADQFDETAGKYIAANSTKEQMIFCTETDIEPQMVYYAQRNIRQVKNTAEARAFLKQRGIATGMMFYISPQQGITAEKVTAE